jgi:uncharacterized protein (TIGR03032 family)
MDKITPFQCTFTPNFPELLQKLGCTLVITTFQAGKVIFISPKNENELIQLPRTFHRPMGMSIEGDKMAIATKEEVIVLRNSPDLAFHYPAKKAVYDGLFVPRATYNTGRVDIHDLHWGNDGLWAVNTLFSCVCKIDDNFSFTPVWKPPFITEIAGEDRCHLNGLAMDENKKPLYISALGKGDHVQAWRENIVKGGIIMHLPSNEIIIDGLAMPHSPRIYDGKLYVLLSAAEQLVCIDPEKGTYEVVAEIPGFLRGMTRHGDFLFVATSKLRKNSSTFKHLKIAEKSDIASVYLVHLPSGAIMSQLTYHTSVDEIYDIQVLPGILRPNIMNSYGEAHHRAIHLPDTTYWAAEEQPDFP